MITFEGWTSGGPLGGWLVFAGRENAREDRGEALVSRVWIFTPCRDKRAFRATLRHRHKHSCHHQYCSYLDDGDGKRGHVMWRDPCVAGNSNDEDLEKVKVEGMINLINYPFYFGRRSKKCHAVSVHWYCLLWWQTALPPQTFHCQRHHHYHRPQYQQQYYELIVVVKLRENWHLQKTFENRGLCIYCHVPYQDTAHNSFVCRKVWNNPLKIALWSVFLIRLVTLRLYNADWSRKQSLIWFEYWARYNCPWIIGYPEWDGSHQRSQIPSSLEIADDFLAVQDNSISALATHWVILWVIDLLILEPSEK